MKYFSTRNHQHIVSAKEALMSGLAPDGGLYFPVEIPPLKKMFYDTIEDLDDVSIAREILFPFFAPEIAKETMTHVVEEAFNFPIEVKYLGDNISILELFHGPTGAFKDMGARFMSRLLSSQFHSEEMTVLVATSGDTGGAVANGFFDIPGIRVIVLFPKNQISHYQEHQITSLGKNIVGVEVEGSFDDCQKLVKTAFSDQQLRNKINLLSANSINIGRLLPQMVYYTLAYKQLIKENRHLRLVVSVPSGNLGNITAGLMAKRMGLPIKHFIAAHNDNDTFSRYLENGIYNPKPSKATYSNAMDVGDPSNFERILCLYEDNYAAIRSDISGFSVNNKETLSSMKSCYNQYNYVLDPHGAVGMLALSQTKEKNEIGLFLGTAHPKKFADVVKKVVPSVEIPQVDLLRCKKQHIANDYEALATLINT